MTTPDPSKLRSLLSEAVTVANSGADLLKRIDATKAILAALPGLLDEVDRLARERDEARDFLDNAVSKAPEPLRALGEYLGRLLDEDRWPEAERYLNASLSLEARALAAEAKVKEAEGVIEPFARQRPHKNEDGSNGILVPATVADVRNARQFLTPGAHP